MFSFNDFLFKSTLICIFPLLTSDMFLRSWSNQSKSQIMDKISKTTKETHEF